PGPAAYPARRRTLAGRAHGRTRPCWCLPACRRRGSVAASFIVLADTSFDFRTVDAQQVDFLDAEPGPAEQAAQARHELLGMSRIEEADSDQGALQVGVHGLDLGAVGGLALGGTRRPSGAGDTGLPPCRAGLECFA